MRYEIGSRDIILEEQHVMTLDMRHDATSKRGNMQISLRIVPFRMPANCSRHDVVYVKSFVFCSIRNRHRH